ncbi:MAG: hypothetical protein K6U14_01960 [Firmicutes bacterium]|nr:hypothetical protein [Alicyclobacillaceae bacterium]MCL6496385.1 hypothetical protein [Bacillota bacterium]
MANGQNAGPNGLRQLIRQELARLGVSAQSGGAEPGGSADQSGSSGSGLSAAEIQSIVRQELLALQKSSQNPSASNGQGGNNAAAAGGAGGGQRWGRLGSGGSRSSGAGSSGAGGKRYTVRPKAAATAQSVAGVLTQAQYELSQELEANLKKLKAVIRESQEIARKIELVLGQGPGKSSS